MGGVAVGTAEIGYGCVVLSKAINGFYSDYNSISDLKNNSYYKEGRPSGGNPKEDSLIRKDKAKVKSQDFIDFLKANNENPSKWEKVMETWETSGGVRYERHYWTNGVKSYYHD